jgi:myo-inositol-1(or 4)-monophosphatase
MAAATMNPIDADLFGHFLRTVTDSLALLAGPPQMGDTLDEIIRRVETVSADARAALAALLDPHYPTIGWSDAENRPERQTRPALNESFWIYDPIDGAYHFAQGLPLWSASLALVSGGRTILAFVYDPTLRELFVAVEGAGATMNDRPLRPSSKTELRHAVVATAIPPFHSVEPEMHDRSLASLATVSRRTFITRQMASASLQLAYVAAGRLDGYWEFGRDIHDWLAGAMLVREAGAVVTDLAGRPFDWQADGIAAGPAALQRELHGAIADAA